MKPNLMKHWQKIKNNCTKTIRLWFESYANISLLAVGFKRAGGAVGFKRAEGAGGAVSAAERSSGAEGEEDNLSYPLGISMYRVFLAPKSYIWDWTKCTTL